MTAAQDFDAAVFAKALHATAVRRGTTVQIANTMEILQNIAQSPELEAMWRKYQKQFAYAADIEYDQIIATLRIDG